MKNYEKYEDEIKEYKGTRFCKDFIKQYILKSDDCINVGCARCKMLQTLWLLEDCEESEIDWSKVEVDTPLLVRNYKNGEWYKRYFAKYEDGKVYAWCNGRTSWNETGIYAWRYAKLAEPEVDWNKVEVDTAIYVKASKNGNWFKRHFAEYKNGKIYTWGNGLTSHDTPRMMEWNYAKLAESERKDNISESNANNRR